MKYGLIFMFIALSFYALSGETITIDLPGIQLDRQSNITLFTSSESMPMPSEPGAPAIPVVTRFFDIPSGMDIESIHVIAGDTEIVSLAQPPAPVQQPSPLSYQVRSQSIDTLDPDRIPTKYLRNYGSGYRGNRKIGWIALQRCLYHPNDQTIEIPARFELEITYTTDPIQPAIHQSSNRGTAGYLLIASDEYLATLESLVEWRYRGGYDCYTQSVEWIDANVTGNDLQQKIRNYITQMVNEHQINYVTLAGDSDTIPVRHFFAFDCAYGIYDDENQIPSDMYYSCLDGDWDANANGIYGEDDDEPDYFPDVYLSRISARSNEHFESYIARLIEYESGVLDSYETAGGVSMELWQGSHSEVAQQYIYERYFPEEYDITLLYGSENTTENALSLIDQNPNIFQHTGHAAYTVLSLEEGSLRITDLLTMTNDNAGMFYSIGCWSAALDYQSIGEKIVTPDAGGFVAYIGNSRYGWGAPAAPGFGFSEYFQKEFFHVLFQGNPMLSQVNEEQKLPFIPMYQGTSVYKWCAYQLNMIGDSALQLFTSQPEEIAYTVQSSESEIIFNVYSQASGLPIEGSWVSLGGTIRAQTDSSGRAIIPIDRPVLGMLTIIAPGFIAVHVEDFYSDSYLQPYVSEVHWDDDSNLVAPGSSFSVDIVLTNPTAQIFTLEYQLADANELITFDDNAGTILLTPNNPVQTITVTGILDDYSSSFDGIDAIPIDLTCQQGEATILTHSINLEVARPGFALAIDPVVTSNFHLLLHTNVTNSGNLSTMQFFVDGTFISDDATLDNVPLEISLPYMIDDIIEFDLPVTVSDSQPTMSVLELELTFRTYYEEQVFEETQLVSIPYGSLSIEEDFEGDNMWMYEEPWQTVDTYAFSGTNSFSCRPSVSGFYTALTDWSALMEDAELSFQYKYKMPMYGDDGVFIIYETDTFADTLLFLGAGGALDDRDRPVPQVYIEGDWAEYRIDLSDHLIDAEDHFGEYFHIRFDFLCSEIIEGFTEYGSMDEIGIFIDDFSYQPPEIDFDIDEDEGKPITLSIYPNPVCGNFLNIAFSIPSDKNASVEIFNIRGQKVRSFDPTDKRSVIWDLQDATGKKAASGIYFARIKSAGKQIIRKFLVIR